jgi:hypothetical protein
MELSLVDTIQMPSKLRGRSIHENVIPTVCNLKNMIVKLTAVNGDYAKLKPWEKRSYKAYQFDTIKSLILDASSSDKVDIIKKHILRGNPTDFGASCIDIYLVAFVAESYGPGKQTFFKYIKDNGISDKEGSAQAIWQVGKGDGVFLGILNDDGTIKDWNFFVSWIKGK